MDGEIDGDTLEALLDADEAVRIVDIRRPQSFQRSHIPGSVNVPFADLPARIDEVADADRVVTVCPHGKASVKAARLLASYGAFEGRVESLYGGLEAWEGPIDAGDRPASTDEEGPEAPF